ncbi:MAG: HAD-IC family P-type ATPase, partial [Chloroflexi bacterium]|nr:HAD-IC family P-type ATPase [Chloroflexota bacterium]
MHEETHPVTQPAATRHWHALPAAEVGIIAGVDTATGLSSNEANRLLNEVGPNRLREVRRKSLFAAIVDELREPLILLLLFTGVLYGVWGRPVDALTIFFVIVTLALVEVMNERRAVNAIAALRQMSEPTTPVLRSSQRIEAPAERIVPGDVIALEAGRLVSADARLVQSYGLAADESALTGESVPAEKDADQVLPDECPLSERSNMVYAGSAVVRGRGLAVVVATGMATELGHTAQLAREARPGRTPLQKAMRQLSKSLVWLALGFSVLVPLLGVLIGRQPLQQMVLTGLSLAFATIPEEMPIIITMVLALGAYRLSRQNAIVKKLQAVENLGAVTVIATDKTGTLTENRMALSRCYPEAWSNAILHIGAVCNDASLDLLGRGKGDPLDLALIRAAKDAGLDPDALCRADPLRTEFTFDSRRKRMSVVYRRDEALWVGVKGSVEAVLERCDIDTAGSAVAMLAADAMARDGLRVIAFAEKTIPGGSLGHAQLPTQEQAESHLEFVGLAGFHDPPRPEARAAIAAGNAAGIRTLMVTGDHPLTAMSIARAIGIDTNGPALTGADLDALPPAEWPAALARASVFARTTPEHKLRLVEALRGQSQVVAVTGDGVNDAPALAAADIGIAMGATGTDVAR